mmetsp:Transcript_27007/g.64968  ORF Transcript_27007/g.64968 Transcript_27007/m.64968 type:complete len:226 (-) Transcript_27007:782-1459(-)
MWTPRCRSFCTRLSALAQCFLGSLLNLSTFPPSFSRTISCGKCTARTRPRCIQGKSTCSSGAVSNSRTCPSVGTSYWTFKYIDTSRASKLKIFTPFSRLVVTPGTRWMSGNPGAAPSARGRAGKWVTPGGNGGWVYGELVTWQAGIAGRCRGMVDRNWCVTVGSNRNSCADPILFRCRSSSLRADPSPSTRCIAWRSRFSSMNGIKVTPPQGTLTPSISISKAVG